MLAKPGRQIRNACYQPAEIGETAEQPPVGLRQAVSSRSGVRKSVSLWYFRIYGRFNGVKITSTLRGWSMEILEQKYANSVHRPPNVRLGLSDGRFYRIGRFIRTAIVSRILYAIGGRYLHQPKFGKRPLNWRIVWNAWHLNTLKFLEESEEHIPTYLWLSKSKVESSSLANIGSFANFLFFAVYRPVFHKTRTDRLTESFHGFYNINVSEWLFQTNTNWCQRWKSRGRYRTHASPYLLGNDLWPGYRLSMHVCALQNAPIYTRTRRRNTIE